MKLTDEDYMPFGKFRGKPMEQVPANYLLWLKDNVVPTYATQNVFDYINDNIEVLKKELK